MRGTPSFRSWLLVAASCCCCCAWMMGTILVWSPTIANAFSTSPGIHLSREQRWNRPTNILIRRWVSTEDDTASSSLPAAAKTSKPPPSARSVAAHFLMQQWCNTTKTTPPKKNMDTLLMLLQDDRDRRLVRLILSTTQRRQGQLDRLLAMHTQNGKLPRFRKNRPVDQLLLAVLRIGIAQLVFLEMPPYAVIQETVQVLKTSSIAVPPSKIKFANAILRSVQRKLEQQQEDDLIVASTNVLDNCHEWLREQWIKAYGIETTTTMMNAFMEEPVIFVTPKSSSSVIALLFGDDAADDDETVVVLGQGSIVPPKGWSGSPTTWPGFEDGSWWIQDVSATLPVLALLEACQQSNRNNITVCDVCAAPGGKTAQLAAATNVVHRVAAIEASARRISTLKSNLERLRMTDKVDVIEMDARDYYYHGDDDDKAFAAVLVDAPCSATGIGRRHPDVLQKDPRLFHNLDELVSLQRELVQHATEHLLQDQGILVYATCSLLPQECEDQVEWFLQNIPDLELVPMDASSESYLQDGLHQAIDGQGCLRLLPGVLPGWYSKCDGFFVARFRKQVLSTAS